MNIDWTTVIVTLITVLLSEGFVFGLYRLIKYRKQDTTIKDNEASNSTTESINMQLSLMKTYWTDMMEMMEQVKQSSLQGTVNQNEIIQSIRVLDKRMDSMEVTLADLVEWADGPFNQFKADKENNNNKQKTLDGDKPKSKKAS